MFGEDIPIPPRAAKPKSPPAMEHDKPFKPSNPGKRGYNRTLQKFPEYKENPTKPLVRKMPVEG